MKRALSAIPVVAGLALLAFAAPALAQDYPTRNVTFIVPTGPGAGTDLLARILATKLTDRLGKSFVVENRPGAGTIIAASAVAKSVPKRLHAADGDEHAARHQCDAPQETPLRPGQGLHAAGADRHRAIVLVVNNDVAAHSA